jgi:hypothetical protein
MREMRKQGQGSMPAFAPKRTILSPEDFTG